MTTHRQLGRFELRRVLGKGAQATVWLGFDARLEREVAIKLLAPGAAADEAAQWLHEARSVSRLNHPNIVPVFEADIAGGQPYLVFEFVPGRTLAEHGRERGPLPPHEAVALMLGVLDALAAAHAAGIVHRDLKPSNVLVDAAGTARVMDFGIAARTAAPGSGGTPNRVVGTPGYLSPEAADGQPPSPAMDVFSAGLVLVELMAGRPVIDERDPYRAMYRIAHEDLALPAELPAAVGDRLRTLLLRAIARRADARWPGAAAFAEALRGWMTPAAGNAAAVAGNGGTLDFLLLRMRHKSDFPALSDSVARIQRVANSENESLASLSAAILEDVALTNKLLRMVNTAHYSHAGGGSISTVSRAVALVGFAGIRNMALSLVLLEHMHDKAHAARLREEFLRALMAGTLAHELCATTRDTEEAFIGAMFQNLGRLLTEYYFPEEARQVRAFAAATRPGPAGEEAAAASVLGIGFQDLGLGIARKWGLPESLQRCMARPAGDPPARLVDKAPERLRWVALAANEVTDALMLAEPAQLPAKLEALGERHGRALGLTAKQIAAAAGVARRRLVEVAQAMNLHVAAGSPARRLLADPLDAPAEHDSLAGHRLVATAEVAPEPAREAAATAPGEAAAMLAAGIQDITNSMVEDFRLNEVLRMILETMFRALGFRRVVFCLRDPKTETLTGRFGLGEGVDAAKAAFKVPLRQGSDLFAAVCAKGADTLIGDAAEPTVAARLPAWFRAPVAGQAFLLLPLQLKGATFALIYADKAERHAIALGERELSLLRTLRNQAVMAFRQAT